MFNEDVKALYPSVKFKFLEKALYHVFDTCTDWNDQIKNHLIELIIYTLEHQQVLWNGDYYILKQGIATDIKLWKLFIDDGVGVFNGSINDFLGFFRLLQESFRKFDFEITCDTDTHTISETGTVSEKTRYVHHLS